MRSLLQAFQFALLRARILEQKIAEFPHKGKRNNTPSEVVIGTSVKKSYEALSLLKDQIEEHQDNDGSNGTG